MNLNKYLLPAAIVVAGVLVAGTFVYIKYFPLSTLSSQEAAEKTMAFINQNIEQGAVASLVQATEEDNVYKISLKINETSYESYITKDGKFLFPSGINLEAAATELSGEQTSAETAIASASFAQCLTEKGMKFYGSKNCGWCNKEKEDFGSSLQYVNYIECLDEKTGGLTPECEAEGILTPGGLGVPTWQLPSGEKQSGYQTLEQLAEASGCSL